MDPSARQEFVDRLLQQETRVSDAQLAESRRKLQTKLAEASRRERRMRAAIFAMAAVVILGYCYFLIERVLSPGAASAFPHLEKLLAPLPETVRTIIGIALGVCYLTCAVCLIPFLMLYFLQYRRKVQQIQQEQILAILVDVQRQIADLREITRRQP